MVWNITSKWSQLSLSIFVHITKGELGPLYVSIGEDANKTITASSKALEKKNTRINDIMANHFVVFYFY